MFFYEDDDFDEMEEKYDYHEDKKIDDAFMPRKFIDVEKNPQLNLKTNVGIA
ncbi:TPA: hypothetical protein O5B58_002820 [Staphylococcus aureus]|nr:hypothetical protein [Staphylococcus aureus]HDA4304975.1 hypothetical protein [Staphylococcus aureus]